MSEERARPLVLFGCGKIAEVVLHVLRHRGDLFVESATMFASGIVLNVGHFLCLA